MSNSDDNGGVSEVLGLLIRDEGGGGAGGGGYDTIRRDRYDHSSSSVAITINTLMTRLRNAFGKPKGNEDIELVVRGSSTEEANEGEIPRPTPVSLYLSPETIARLSNMVSKPTEQLSQAISKRPLTSVCGALMLGTAISGALFASTLISNNKAFDKFLADREAIGREWWDNACQNESTRPISEFCRPRIAGIFTYDLTDPSSPPSREKASSSGV